MITTKINTYLGLTVKELQIKGARHTAREIGQQPQLWMSTWAKVEKHKASLEIFLDSIFEQDKLDIILTGAGTSAFIGNILEGPFQKNTGKNTRAVASTDLVSHPKNSFHYNNPTLLISFARSGNSPESIAAIELANKCCKEVYHLVITCNPEGKLASSINPAQTYVFLLPPEADDQGLAMTGSFTSMLLTGLLISRLHELYHLKKQVEILASYAEYMLANHVSRLKEVAELDFNRAVFLGSGPLQGTARESQLKMQELTDGKIIGKYDSFLGFRHGPKVVIDGSTLLVYLFSNKEYVHRYEADLVKAINAGEKGLFSIGISESDSEDIDVDLKIVFSKGGEIIDEEFLSICSVLPVQILSFFKSLQLGLMPDSPSSNGTITRVVEGVVIYPYAPGTKKVKI